MELKIFMRLLAAKKSFIFTVVAIFAILAVGLSFLQPLKYRSSTKLLVVQQGTGSDTYATMRSTEYLGKVLSNVTVSTGFAEKVFAGDNSINRGYFGDNSRLLAKNWGKTVDAKSIAETGIIQIDVYHVDRSQAEKLASDISSTMIAQNGDYHGLKDAVQIKQLEQPITSSYPVKPNLPVNSALGVCAGLFVAVSWLYFWFSGLEINYNLNNNIQTHDYHNFADNPGQEAAYENSRNISSDNDAVFSIPPLKPEGITPGAANFAPGYSSLNSFNG